jgi:hypothetical protein
LSLDPYTILDVKPGVSSGDLKSAWHGRLKLYHPDRLGPAPPDEIRAAEEMTKIINMAYDMLQQAMDQSSPSSAYADKTSQPRQNVHARSGPSWEASAGRRQTAESVIPSARDFFYRGRASTDYADGLLDRWRQESRGFRAALSQLTEALDVMTIRLKRVRDIEENLRMAPSRCVQLARDMIRDRLSGLVDELLNRAEVMSGELERRSRMKPNTRRDEKTEKDRGLIEAILVEAEHALILKPESLSALLMDVNQAMRREAGILKRSVDDSRLWFDEYASAYKRSQSSYRALSTRLKAAQRALVGAEPTVRRAVVTAATAVGMARSEEGNAKENQARWIATRTLDATLEIRTKAEELDLEWERAHHILIEMKARWDAARTLVKKSTDDVNVSQQIVARLGDLLSTFLTTLQTANVEGMNQVGLELNASFDKLRARLNSI